MSRRIVLLTLLVLAASPVAAQAGVILPTSRPADPAGRITPLQAFPSGVAVSPDGNTVLAIAGPALQGGLPATPPDPLPQPGVQVYVIDGSTGAVRQVLNLADALQGGVFAPDGQRAYVAGGGAHSVEEIDFDGAGRASVGPSFQVTGFATALALERGAGRIWVGEPNTGQVQLLDLSSGAVVRTIAVPGANQLALAPDGSALYVADWRGTAVHTIDLAAGSVSAVSTGAHPTGLAVASSGQVLSADAND